MDYKYYIGKALDAENDNAKKYVLRSGKRYSI